MGESKKFKRPRWPRGLRIHPCNNFLLGFADTHLAKMAILAHAKCCRDCVGREIPWTGKEHEAFDQSWDSKLIGRQFAFSSYGYCFLSFSLILEEWNSHPPFVTEAEKATFVRVLLQEKLLDECQLAANKEKNTRVLDLLPSIRSYNDLLLKAINYRWEVDGLENPQLSADCDDLKVLHLLFPGSYSAS
jgi:hypothetical protein